MLSTARQNSERSSEQIALQKEAELQQYRQYSAQQSNQVLAKEEEALVSKESQIDDVYRKAVESGDADLITKAAKLPERHIYSKRKAACSQGQNSRPQCKSRSMSRKAMSRLCNRSNTSRLNKRFSRRRRFRMA